MYKNIGTFSSGIKKARLNIEKKDGKKCTQADLAKMLNVSLKTIQNWEQGLSLPTTNEILKLCDFFQCDLDYLFDRIETKKHDTEFIHNSTGLSEKSIERLASLLSGSTEDHLLHTDDCNKKETEQEKKENLTLAIINQLLENDYSYRVLTEDLHSCYARYYFHQKGLNQYKEEENAIRAMGITKEIKLHESGNYQEGISDDQLQDRLASYESKLNSASEHYRSIINHIMMMLYINDPQK